MQTVTVFYKTDQSNKPLASGRVELRPELLPMETYEAMTAAAITALEACKTARLPIECNNRRCGYKLIVEMNGNGNGAEVYVTRDIITACRAYDDVNLKNLAATALMAVRQVAETHFPQLL